MKKFLFASDSFKGSLSSLEIAAILEREARLCFPDCQCVCLSVADGGEGTMETVLRELGGSLIQAEVRDPLGRKIKASYGALDGKRAFIEMAKASGLPLLNQEERDPMETTTYGTGQLILDALERGYRQITIAIGGSATNDGGMGAMRALGARFLDESGRELFGRGKDLLSVCRIETEGLSPLIKEAVFTVMCDVKNPLTGENGATYTFGLQKGGTPESMELLETGMKRYETLLKAVGGPDAGDRAGDGAAGGLGAALSVFLKAEMKPGIEAVLELLNFDRKLQGIDLVVTGEGRIDWQSSYGKVPGGVGDHCKKMGVPAVAIVGGVGKGAKAIYEHGIICIIPVVDRAMELEEAMRNAEKLYSGAAARMFRLLKIGMGMAGTKLK